MKSCEYGGAPFTEARSHPWTDAVSSAAYRYYDFKAEPARIRTSLEDFTRWDHYPAMDQMYTMLEWINADGSVLESNDSAFTGPHETENASSPGEIECSGRLMVLYHNLEKNLFCPRIVALKNEVHHRLGAIDAGFASGMIGTTIVPVRYVTLPGDADQQIGTQLMISFWAWGESEVDLMGNLARVLRNLSEALKTVKRGR